MPNSTYETRPNIQVSMSGFDRPNELFQIVVEGVRKFFGYKSQCEANLKNFPGDIVPLNYEQNC